MKNLFTYLKALWGAWGNLQSNDVSFDCRLTVGSPSFDCRSAMLKLVSVLALIFTLGVGQAWGADATMTGVSNATASTVNKKTAFKCATGSRAGSMKVTVPTGANVISFYCAGWNGKSVTVSVTPTDKVNTTSFSPTSDSGISGSGTSYTLSGTESTYLKTITLKSITASTDITFSTSKDKQFVLWGAKYCFNPTSPTNGTIGSATARLSWTDTHSVGYYELYYSKSSTAPTMATAATVTDITNTYADLISLDASATYYWWVRAYDNYCKSEWVAGSSFTTTSGASCSADPTIGTASLNGSFNMTSTTSSIDVSSGTCSTGNAACDWTDYGFVWSDGANTTTPTVGGTNCNKVKVGESGTGTSWTGSITPSGSTTPTSWTMGHTYYVRTYGKNSKAGAAFVEGSAWSFTPYMVTFNKNDGGATISTQYVQGGVSTPLTSNSFSRTGYTFNGWNTDADGTSGTGYTNGQSVSLSANLTLYAKWSAKQCTISFDIEGGTGTITNVTATYGQAMPSKESNLPTKTGYNFGGFWDGDGGTGTQYYNADGTSKINWNKDVTATQTLYAKWTIKNYTVTWKVNGEDYTAGTPTDNVNHGSHVTTLPTAPDPGSYCGDKFMGWTDATDGAYVHGTSNLYTKASEFPNATAAQTFYAVFADYDD